MPNKIVIKTCNNLIGVQFKERMLSGDMFLEGRVNVLGTRNVSPYVIYSVIIILLLKCVNFLDLLNWQICH